ncbi:hypothetical protein [Flavobacterium aquidurense]|uniref:Uncharacterized protein n=1 Tax=Flavobacterium aquidurense TaxID=362413 RepID=A0A0Q0W7L7_9FLAO|nr:hypothetical protein [Flavobacterium aquidurense]KQB40381.1 hypothetical protein RC62_271 [Flavobacterium aquidurense]
MKKIIYSFIIIAILQLLFLDRCTTYNITTNDLFKSKDLKNSKSLIEKPQSKNYEIVPVEGTFPILYDSINNDFYVSNNKGLTKYDYLGNIVISDDLAKEKYTSVFDFANFIPYVFAENGVYDFSGKKLAYTKFLQILNSQNEIKDADFKLLFEKYYNEAEVVVYDTDRNFDYQADNLPMYFKIKNNWILLFSQKGDHRFTHSQNSEFETDTIGQIDFLNLPAKFADKRLIVLKNQKKRIYSTKQIGEKIDDNYLKMYSTQLLQEQKFDYQSSNSIQLISRKKDEYYYTGGYFNFPDWVSPSFINTAYYQVIYNNESLFFKEKAIKYFKNLECKNDLYLYELPKHLRTKSKVAFMHYAVNVGGYANDSTGIYEPIIKNAGLYILRQKTTANNLTRL